MFRKTQTRGVSSAQFVTVSPVVSSDPQEPSCEQAEPMLMLSADLPLTFSIRRVACCNCLSKSYNMTKHMEKYIQNVGKESYELLNFTVYFLTRLWRWSFQGQGVPYLVTSFFCHSRLALERVAKQHHHCNNYGIISSKNKKLFCLVIIQLLCSALTM